MAKTAYLKMTATKLKEEYKGGKRNFQRINLKGQSLKNADLQGIDLSGSLLQRTNFQGAKLQNSNLSHTKLHGANFVDANLSDADLSHARTGLLTCQSLFLGFISIILTVGGITVALLMGLFAALFLDNELRYSQSDDPYWMVITYVVILVVGFLHFTVISLSRTMTEAVFGFFVAVLAFLLVMTGQPLIIGLAWFLLLTGMIRVMTVLWHLNHALAVMPPLFLLVLGAIILYNYDLVKQADQAPIPFISMGLVATILASLRLSVTFFELNAIAKWARIVSITFVSLFLFALWFVLLIGFIGNEPNRSEYIYAYLIFFLGPLVTFLLSLYLNWQASLDHPNYRAIRDRGVFFVNFFGWFGTRFQKANLTRANFACATLKNANFSEAVINHANWYHAKRLESAVFGRSYLRYPQVRQWFSQLVPKLPSRRRVFRRHFEQCDLSGIRFSRCETGGASSQQEPLSLVGASFRGADLNDADLNGVDLSHTSLVGARLLGANLNHANLTGVCIQDWHINSTTTFDDARCDFLYLREATPGNLDRVEVKPQLPLNADTLQELIIPIDEQKKLDKLYEEFSKIDLIRDKVMREFRLNQAAAQAQQNYNLNEDIYRQLFDDYHKQKILSERRHSWWQSFLWFQVEPWIEKINKQTQDLDIFPLLENLGRLSILVAVITFVNSWLKPDVNVEKQYRPWEMIRAENENVRGISRIALEQLRAEGSTLVGLRASGVNLNRINLSGANLKNADLSYSQLQEAILTRTTLRNATLEGANLMGASLGYSAPDDNGSNEARSELIKKALPPNMKRGANLKQANLKKANLEKAKFEDADLDGAKLQKANLTGADFRGAKNLNLNVQNNEMFVGAFYTYEPPKLPNIESDNQDRFGDERSNDPEKLGIIHIASQKDLSGRDLSYLDLRGLDLSKTILVGTNLIGAQLQRANLQGAKLQGAKYSRETKFPRKFQPAAAGMILVETK